MERLDKALKMFSTGSNCAQAVAAAYGPLLGVLQELAHRAMTGFGAGMGKKQYTCGAVSGAVFLLSMKHGGATSEARAEKKKTYALVHAYITEFERLKGSSSCDALLSFDLNNEDEYARAKTGGVFDTICRECVRTACKLFEEYLGCT